MHGTCSITNSQCQYQADQSSIANWQYQVYQIRVVWSICVHQTSRHFCLQSFFAFPLVSVFIAPFAFGGHFCLQFYRRDLNYVPFFTLHGFTWAKFHPRSSSECRNDSDDFFFTRVGAIAQAELTSVQHSSGKPTVWDCLCAKFAISPHCKPWSCLQLQPSLNVS